MSVRRDRDNIQKEVQTLSEQLTQALKQIGDLTSELGQTQRMIPSIESVPSLLQPVITAPTTLQRTAILVEERPHACLAMRINASEPIRMSQIRDPFPLELIARLEDVSRDLSQMWGIPEGLEI